MRANRAIAIVALAAAAAGCKGDPEATSAPPRPLFTPPDDGFLDSGGARRERPTGVLMIDPGAETPALVAQAVATLRPTDNNRAAGTLRFAEGPDGLTIDVKLTGLAFLSKYSIRVHMLGDCSSKDGVSAGPGFNFDGSSLRPPPVSNVGELGVIEADVGGEAEGQTTLELPALQGPYSIVGRTVVVHASGGSGDEGARLACGVIGIFADVPGASGD